MDSSIAQPRPSNTFTLSRFLQNVSWNMVSSLCQRSTPRHRIILEILRLSTDFNIDNLGTEILIWRTFDYQIPDLPLPADYIQKSPPFSSRNYPSFIFPPMSVGIPATLRMRAQNKLK